MTKHENKIPRKTHGELEPLTLQELRRELKEVRLGPKDPTPGLLSEQIDKLMRKMPTIRAKLDPRPPVTAVREPLEALGKALRNAREALAYIADAHPAKDSHRARFWAELRLDDELLRKIDSTAALRALEGLGAIGTLDKHLRTAEEATTRAAQSLPKRQPANAYHDAEAVYRIDSVLQRSYWEATGRKSMTNYPLRMSRTGAFAEVAHLCFRAAGRRDCDRAIKLALKLAARREAGRCKVLGLPPKKRGKGRPRKLDN